MADMTSNNWQGQTDVTRTDSEISDNHYKQIAELRRLTQPATIIKNGTAKIGDQIIVHRRRMLNNVPIDESLNVRLISPLGNGKNMNSWMATIRPPSGKPITLLQWQVAICSGPNQEYIVQEGPWPTREWLGNPAKDEFIALVTPPNVNSQAAKRAAWCVRTSDPTSSEFDNDDTISTIRVLQNERSRLALNDRVFSIIGPNNGSPGYTALQRNAPACGYSTEMTAIWHEFLSLPKRNLRTLLGSAHTSARNAFQHGQLSLDRGQYFVQTNTIRPERSQDDTATTDDGAATAASKADLRAAAEDEKKQKELEDDNTAIRKARQQAGLGFLGKAANLLFAYASPPAAKISTQQMVDNLARLHPRGTAPGPFPTETRSAFAKLPAPTLAQIQEATKRGMKGASPGPTGWTEELLYPILCANDIRSNEVIAMYHDLLRNRVHPSVALRLSNATLIGLPKPDGGTRPIAMGEVCTKIATRIAITRDEKELRNTFNNLQFGVAVRGGGERIVHAVREFTRSMVTKTSRCVLCIDFSNAFNAPLRTEMAKQAALFPNLAPIFELEYAHSSSLFVRGSGGASIPSERGARQGTTSGPVFFCLAIQPMLNLLNKLPDVKVMAYMDDITLMCETHATADAALKVVQEEAAKLNIAVNLKKCELYVAAMHRSSSALAQFGVPSGNACLKLLGAAIGTTAEEESVKVDSLCGPARFEVLFRRLMAGMLGAAGIAVLSKCCIPKLSYAIRTHEPVVVYKCAQWFDASVIQCIQRWALASLDEVSRALACLPIRMGGLGLTPQVEILPGAYAASRGTALGGNEDGVLLSQSAHSNVVFQKIADKIDEDKMIARHREHSSQQHTASLFFACDLQVPGSDFSAALRWRLFAPVAGSHTGMECPGCHATFKDPRDWMRHTPNCQRVPGHNSNSRHAALKLTVKQFLADNNIQFGSTEPRHCHVVNCPGCNEKMLLDKFEEHGANCAALKVNPAAAKPRATGPDIAVYMPTGEFDGQLVDVTVCASECQTHCGKPLEEAFCAAEKDKARNYEEFIPEGQKLVVFGCTENGVLSAQASAFVNRVTSSSRGNAHTARRLIAARALAAHGSSLCNAERQAGYKVIPAAYKPPRVIRRALTFNEPAPSPTPAVSAPSAAIAPVTVALANVVLTPLTQPVATRVPDVVSAPLVEYTSGDAAIVGVLVQRPNTTAPAVASGTVTAATDGAIASHTQLQPQAAPMLPPAARVNTSPLSASYSTVNTSSVDAPSSNQLDPRRVQSVHSECPPAWSANGFEQNGPAQQLQPPTPVPQPTTPEDTPSGELPDYDSDDDSAVTAANAASNNQQVVRRNAPSFSYNGDLVTTLSPGRTTLMQSREAGSWLSRLHGTPDAFDVMLTSSNPDAKTLRFTITCLLRLSKVDEWRNNSQPASAFHHFLSQIDANRASSGQPPVFFDADRRGLVLAGLTRFGVFSRVWNNRWSSANVVNGYDTNAQPPRATIDFDVASRLALQIQARSAPSSSAGIIPAPISAPNNNNNTQQDGCSTGDSQQ